LIRVEASNTSFLYCLNRYEEEQSNRRAFASLKTQLKQLRASNLSHLSLADIIPKLLSQYRDDRMATGISAASCIRDLGMLHHLFEHIQKEWQINLPQGNPLNQVSNPKHTSPTSRDRRLVDDEEERTLNYLGDHSGQVGLIVRFALATGMRRGGRYLM
jgi:site-specific recombinase XerD